MLRNRLTTLHLLAIRIRSWFRQSLETAATISGVNPSNSGERVCCRAVVQEPLAKLSDGEIGDRRKRRWIMPVDNQPGDFVDLIRYHRVFQEAAQRNVGQHRHRSHALPGVAGSHACQLISGPSGRRLGQDLFQICEGVMRSAKMCRICWHLLFLTEADRPGSAIIACATRCAVSSFFFHECGVTAAPPRPLPL